MKKIYLLGFLACFLLSANAQYSDDFESYSVGSYIGVESDQWTTWSGALGGNEDATIVDDKAKSGNNSIYFYSTDQGPQDVVLDFGQKFTSGTFNLSFSIYVSEGSSAYYNFQQEETIGETWAGNAYITENGVIRIDAGDREHTTPFPTGQWNDIAYEIDLDNNEWKISVNGKCIGVLLAPASVASLDIFPLSQDTPTSEFWIDDVSFSHDATIVNKTLDAALTNSATSGAPFIGSSAAVQTELVNTGSSTITDCIVTLSENGTELDKIELTDLNLEAGESVPVNFEDGFTPSEGIASVSFGIESINGETQDEDPCNNNSTIAVEGINKTPNKAVLVEELTGTWCQYCPAGHVFMERMGKKYKENFIGVAIHGGPDVMAMQDYADHILAIEGNDGYPSVSVDRGNGVHPSAMEQGIVAGLQKSIPATFDIGATYDEDAKELIAYVEMTALEFISATKRVGFILIEDHVTGTTADYNQVNFYSGGDVPMGGYENLPNPVPAADMVYEHVARAILPDPNGMKLDDSMSEGDKRVFVFGLEVPDGWDKENLKLIAFIKAPNPNQDIQNAFLISYEDALNNNITNTEDLEIDYTFSVSPNPAVDMAYVKLNLQETAEVELSVYNAMGQLVKSRNYGLLSNNQIIDLNATDLANGIYTVQISVNGVIDTQKIVISK